MSDFYTENERENGYVDMECPFISYSVFLSVGKFVLVIY